MSPEDIRNYWLASVEMKRMSPDDPNHQVMSMVAADLDEKYHAFMDECNGNAPEQSSVSVSTDDVLHYIGSIFQAMDENPDEPGHSEKKAFRQAAFKKIVKAMTSPLT